MTDNPEEIYIQFAENRIGTEFMIRKWTLHPHDGGRRYVLSDAAIEHVLRQDNALLQGVVNELELQNLRLRAALEKAVEDYGKPGGPWNVPSEPGSWIALAKEALG